MIVNNFINTNLKGVSVETNETPLDPPLHPLVLLWLAPSHKTLKFELNTLNLALGGISVLHKTKYPIASGERSTTMISPPSQKILDPPLHSLYYLWLHCELLASW